MHAKDQTEPETSYLLVLSNPRSERSKATLVSERFLYLNAYNSASGLGTVDTPLKSCWTVCWIVADMSFCNKALHVSLSCYIVGP